MTSPDDTFPRVRVVVLNWNTGWLTARCLRSLLATDHPADRLEIVVVDNASIDGSLERLQHDFPDLTFVRNEANLGFAEGCNRALRDLDGPDQDGPEMVALINNDSTVDPGWLRPLVDVMQADARIGAACPKILLETPDDDGVRRINSMGLARSRQSEGVELHRDEPDDPSRTEPVDVDAFSGGAVLLRVAALEEVGLFDPAFFAYCEDLDLSWRLRRAGWRIVCVPTSVTHHLLHGSGGGPTSGWFFFAYFRNWLLTVLRNGSPREVVLAYRNAVGRTWTTRGHRWRQWVRVWSAVLAGAPGVLASRFGGRRPGHARPARVGSRLMTVPSPKSPVMRPGGPTLVYLDVSHTLVTRLRAGIQRVVRELVRELPVACPDLELVPVVWSPLHDRFRRADAAEYADLLAHATHRAPPVPATPKAWRALVRRVAGPVIDRIRRRRDLRREPPERRQLVLDRLEAGSVFLDADASWNRVTAPRDRLLPQLTADGVVVVPLICDVLPVTHPEWFEPHTVAEFRAHLHAHARAARLVIAISEHTAAEYRTIDPDTPVRVVLLGSDELADGSPLPPVLGERRYLLTVGTIEPRKGHDVLLAAYDELADSHRELHLVVVGREGWGSGDVVDRLRRHASSDDHVHWFHRCTDDELAALYRHAFAVVIPSLEEGYGLPMVEALGVGAVVVSSNAGALPEVGGDHAEYFDPRRPDELVAIVRRLLEDPTHHDERRAAASRFTPRRWDDVVAEVGGIVSSAVGPSAP